MNTFIKFIIIILLASVSADEYITLERKWARIVHKDSHYHIECQEQYQEYKNTFPPNWVVEHQYLNVQAGAFQGNQIVLNCENKVLCKLSTG